MSRGRPLRQSSINLNAKMVSQDPKYLDLDRMRQNMSNLDTMSNLDKIWVKHLSLRKKSEKTVFARRARDMNIPFSD